MLTDRHPWLRLRSGVSGIYTAYAAKHYFDDEMQYLDIVDCNAGNHHKAFATNFNPEINIREITQNGRYYENGQWVTTQPLEIHKDLTYLNIGPRDSICYITKNWNLW